MSAPEEYFLDPNEQEAMGLTLEEGDRLHTRMVPYSFPVMDFVVMEIEADGVAMLWQAEEAVSIPGWDEIVARQWAS